MLLETTRFGVVEVDEAEVYAVPGGIPGFPEMKRVALLGAGNVPGHPPLENQHSLYWMHDLDDENLAFMCVVPWVAFPEYDFDIDDETLGVDDLADVRVLTLVSVRREDGVGQLTTNLRAPIVVDTRKQRLQQIILNDSRWPIRALVTVLVSTEVR